MDARTLCLSVLQQRDASGYDIKKALEQPPYCYFQDTGFGSIYPALAHLAEQGAVEVRAEAQAKRPGRKIYSVTEQGRSQLFAALQQPPADDRFRSDFLFLLYHGDLLPPERILQLVDERIALLEGVVARLAECPLQNKPPMQRFLHELGVDHYRSAARFLRENRARLARELAGPPAAQVAE